MKSLFAKTLFLFALSGVAFIPGTDSRAQEAAATALPPAAETAPPAPDSGAPAIAQGEQAAPMVSPEPTPKLQRSIVGEDRSSTRSKRTDYLVTDDLVSEDGYERATYERLSKLYWALAMFDLKDNQAIDQYLMINECDLYMKFYNDDLALEDLRNVTRDSIVHNLSKAPRTYEIVMPVGLDRYDKGTRRFKINPTSVFVGTKKLEVTLNTLPRMICEKQGPLTKYAWNFILAFSRPFTLTEIPLPPEQAQNLFDIAKEEFDKGVGGKFFEYRDLSQFRRIVFLRLKVTMTQFKGMGRNYSDETVPIIFATIDGFQVYGDIERTRLLYDQEEENRKKMERLKNETASKEDHRKMMPQEGQLLESKDKDSDAYVPQSSYLPSPMQ